MLGIKNIDLLDTLYGGLAGTLSQPDFINEDDDFYNYPFLKRNKK